jgi:phosphoribosylaminoimidazolecarboxamide formyltransferase / IMP cyclohydrolase
MNLPVERALISVYDTTGLIPFARRLVGAGVEIIASGGTAIVLGEGGIPVTTVSEKTGFPEILGGRVKTMHPKILGAILGRADQEDDQEDLREHGIAPIQLVVANLYPFRETASAPGVAESEIIEQIDIGGPAMVRAAAKNHAFVGVVTVPSQYGEVAEKVESGGLDSELRRSLAAEAFFHTAAYDAAIAGWMGNNLVLPLRRFSTMRYGENPHQKAALYLEAEASPWWLTATHHQGKEMSLNNYMDSEAAWRLANDLPAPAVVVVKHTNPCGAASGGSVSNAFAEAWGGDPLAAFGGVIGINGRLDEPTASAIAERFVEVVIAGSADEAALERLAPRKNLRVIIARPPTGTDHDLRRVEGGFLVQDRDAISTEGWEVVSKREPTAEERASLEFAWVVAAHTKSNAIVLASRQKAVGVAAGDQSRVGAAERAVAKAGPRAQGAVAASDAFFPFRDGLDVLADAGVSAVAQPGGSRNDPEIIASADEHGLALMLTGRRHFRH